MSSKELTPSDTIARRTRSKFPIEEDFGCDDLNLPDFSEDLYEPNKEIDNEWAEFLYSLYNDNPSHIFEEEENEDPDYDVLEELDEILRTGDAEANLGETICLPKSLQDVSKQELTEWSKVFTEEDLKLIYTQMAQHVQVLTQQYLLTMTSKTLSSVAENSAKLLMDIRDLGSEKTISLFKPPNLSGALKIVNENPIDPSNITVVANSWRQCPVPLIARPIFAKYPSVFMYHCFLPKSGYPDVHSKNKCLKTIFTDAEDHLIAMGLDQYKAGEKRKCYLLIKENLLPTKTEYQIKMHIKNKTRYLKQILSDPSDEKNPITYYLRYSKLMPTRRRSFPLPNDTYNDLAKLPIWLAKELDPKYSMVDPTKLATKLKLSPLKAITSKYPTNSSPRKHTNSILKKYRYLSKLPYIKPKLDKEQASNMSNKYLPETIAFHYHHPTEIHPIIQLAQPSQIQQFSHIQSTSKMQAQQVSFIPTKEIIESSDKMKTSKSCEAVVETNQSDAEICFKNASDLPPNDNDKESDLAALMVASSTITINKGRTKSHEVQTGTISKKEPKKSQNARHKESTALLLSKNWSFNDCTREQKEQVIVQFFVNKVREVLKSDEDYICFLEYLNEFGQQKQRKNSLKELHGKTEKLMNKANARQVMEEFVLLLNATEAQDCGKMYQYLYWKRYLSFVKSLEIYSLVEPNCVSRLYKSLIQLKASEEKIDKQKLRNTVSKAIGGHPYLMNEFSSLFLDEKPKESLFASDDDFEHAVPLCENSEPGKTYESFYLDLTQEEQKYGTNECPCKHCHNDQSPKDQANASNSNSRDGENDKKSASNNLRHCVACSIRFMGGKVYLQSSKRMQPAEVEYLSPELSTKQASKENSLDSSSSSHNTFSSDVSADVTKDVEMEIDTDTIDDTRQWSKIEDRTLLEYCKARAASDGCVNMYEVFREIGAKLRRSCDQVANRFSTLIELFKNESQSTTEAQVDSTISTPT